MMVTKSVLYTLVLLVSFGSMAQDFYTGVDLSYVNELEGCDAKYLDRDGVQSDAYQLFSEEGARIVRLRLWHNPQWTNYSNLEDVKRSIERAKSANLLVMLDFHYSDFWTDPGRQWRPEAWEGVTDEQVLRDSVYNYTEKTLKELHANNLLPDFVQIGNETNGNILITRGERSLDASDAEELYPVVWSRQVGLLQQGIEAVQHFNESLGASIKTIVHIAGPDDAFYWFKDATEQGLKDFDIIGLSYYPQWNDMGVREVGDFVRRLKETYDKEVMLVETGYPWTTDNGNDNANNVLGLGSRLFTYSNTFSIDTQSAFLKELSWLVKDNGGLGVVYWEPAWVTTTCETFWSVGSHWDNATLFDFEGKLHGGADFLAYDYTAMPEALGEHEVTFNVDMTNKDASEGAYVTGDFTVPSWSLVPMVEKDNHLYELQTNLSGRTQGAYVFYNSNDLSEVNRENVPDACADESESYREYRIKDDKANLHFAWGACDEVPVENILSVGNETHDFSLYPSPAKSTITLTGVDEVIQLELWNATGQKIPARPLGNGEFDVSLLPKGLYTMRFLDISGRVRGSKFLKE